MPLVVTPLFAGLAAIILIALSLRVIKLRTAKKISVGSDDDRLLLRAIRAQANFTEYVPLILLLMALAELQGAYTWLIAAIGAVLLAGRIIHALGLSREPDNFPLRVRGMQLTITALATVATVCVALSLKAIFGL